MIRWLGEGLTFRERTGFWERMSRQRLSAGFYLLASTLHARSRDRLEAHMLGPPAIRKSERDVFYTLDSGVRRGESGQVYEDIVDLWLRTSIQMHNLANNNGFMYLHVLQPNQYHSGKAFSDRERRIALRPGHPYSSAVKKLYPVLIERSRELVEKGVYFIDATAVFDGTDAVIYA
jgi:hypothetical protein